MLIRRRDSLLHSMVNGLEVWLAYATVEYLFATVLPIVLHRDRLLDAARWRGTALLFACYAAWGILNGLVAGAAMDSARNLSLGEFEERVRKFLTRALAITFGLNLLFTPNSSGKVGALLGMALLGFAVMRNLGKSEAYPGVSDSPTAVALVLVISSRVGMVTLRDWPALVIVPAVLVSVVVAGGVSILAIRLMFWLRDGILRSPVLAHGVPAAVVLGIIFGPAFVSSSQAQIGVASASSPSPKSMPNIVMISMDTVRADHMGIYGYSRKNTPNLEELLKESTLYTHLISASAITLTSHASMFTGLYPRSHGAYKQLPGFPLGRPLAEGIPTIASTLEGAGYRSVALSANLWFLGPEWGMLHGFEYTWTPKLTPLIDGHHPYLLRARLGELFVDRPVANDLYASPAVDADVINHRAITILNQLKGQDRPFFLFLNYMDAHWPYRPPEPYDTMFPGRDERFVGQDEGDAVLRNHVDCDGGPIPSGYAAHLTSQYDGAIAYMDSKIAEMVHYLKKNGLYDNTLLIVTADHGEGLGDHGTLSHNASVYQDQVHVPLIVKYPGSHEAARVEQRASHVDFLPTVLDVAGLAPRQDLPGVSLRRLTSIPDRTILSERHYGPCQTMNTKTPEVQFAVFRGTSKLISSSLGLQEFYDLGKDPKEQNNLYSAAPPVELEAFLREWVRNTSRVRQAQQPVDPETLNRLRSLGYLQ